MLNAQMVQKGVPLGIGSFSYVPPVKKGQHLVAVLTIASGTKMAIEIIDEKTFYDVGIFCVTHVGTGYAFFLLGEEEFKSCIT